MTKRMGGKPSESEHKDRDETWQPKDVRGLTNPSEPRDFHQPKEIRKDAPTERYEYTEAIVGSGASSDLGRKDTESLMEQAGFDGDQPEKPKARPRPVRIESREKGKR